MKQSKTNPFRTPDRYFDSLEDRIMGRIEHDIKRKKSTSSRVIQFLKPALGLAASFTLVYLLVYYPMNSFLSKTTAKAEITDTAATEIFEDNPLSFLSIDENTLINAIFSDETSNVSEINQDDMLAYLSSGMNDVEIYSEITN